MESAGLLFATPYSLFASRRGGLARLIGERARERGELAALAIAAILEVDPVVGMDVLGRDVVALLQEAHQAEPGSRLLGRRGLRHVGEIADELDADRVGLDHATVGLGIV